MRCYFLRENRIEAVYLLKAGPDEDLIRQGQALFDGQAGTDVHGFEVWEGRRFVHRFSRPAASDVENKGLP